MAWLLHVVMNNIHSIPFHSIVHSIPSDDRDHQIIELVRWDQIDQIRIFLRRQSDQINQIRSDQIIRSSIIVDQIESPAKAEVRSRPGACPRAGGQRAASRAGGGFGASRPRPWRRRRLAWQQPEPHSRAPIRPITARPPAMRRGPRPRRLPPALPLGPWLCRGPDRAGQPESPPNPTRRLAPRGRNCMKTGSSPRPRPASSSSTSTPRMSGWSMNA